MYNTEDDNYELSIIACSHQICVTSEKNKIDRNKTEILQGNNDENCSNDTKEIILSVKPEPTNFNFDPIHQKIKKEII